jgi:hypothetical protein
MPIPKEFLELLRCPLCLADLREAEERLLCANVRCNLRYEIKEGIPKLLVDEAERPCPKCSTARDRKDNSLVCPKCGETFKPESR